MSRWAQLLGLIGRGHDGGRQCPQRRLRCSVWAAPEVPVLAGETTPAQAGWRPQAGSKSPPRTPGGVRAGGAAGRRAVTTGVNAAREAGPRVVALVAKLCPDAKPSQWFLGCSVLGRILEMRGVALAGIKQ